MVARAATAEGSSRSLCSAERARLLAAATSSDRKSTRLNSSHLVISYAVFCLKKKRKIKSHITPVLSLHLDAPYPHVLAVRHNRLNARRARPPRYVAAQPLRVLLCMRALSLTC